MRNLEVLRQAAKDFGIEELRAHDAQIPWSRIAAMRNVLAHQYLGVDVSLVWNIVERELVGLRSAIEGVLRNLTDESEDGTKS